jgi:two-component system, NtrC family, response regulator GlrR
MSTDLKWESPSNSARQSGLGLIGESPAFLTLMRAVQRISRHATPAVLIHGETGTGKELIARSIHYLGARRDFPFVPVNCGALPDSLAENELFGHRPGAYTGASHESVGLLRLAHRGTLFLDEVDSLPVKTQVALLRVLQDGVFRPLGAAKEEAADIRIVAASNRCLLSEVRAGQFREDLYYRLNRIALEVPPLRERTGDVHILSEHFLKQCAQRYDLPRKSLHESTSAWLGAYAWPGNIRELENLIHREFLLADESELRITAPAALRMERKLVSTSSEQLQLLGYRAAKARALQEFERTYLTELIRRTHGNVTRAAQLAGTERRALGKLLKRYQIERDVHLDES